MHESSAFFASNITMPLNFFHFMMQDSEGFLVFLSFVERLTVSLRLLQDGYSLLPRNGNSRQPV
jgi:hypothetical protein